MPIKIAVPQGDIYRPLYENADAIKDEAELLILDEFSTGKVFAANKVDCALLTPLEYGKATGRQDYRILPESALFLESYTESASLYFNTGLKRISKVKYNDAGEYIRTIMKIILAEKYDFNVEFEKFDAKRLDGLLENADAAFIRGKEPGPHYSLDMSEEWFDISEIQLPMAFWVVRSEETPEGIKEIVAKLSEKAPANFLPVTDKNSFTNENGHRMGKIHYRWSMELESSVHFALQLLFYHQFLKEISDVKLFGVD
jgi:predicted solute-binding protein